MKTKHTYKILDDNEEDKTAIRIEKGNITHSFLIAEILQEQEEAKRYIAEFKRQRENELARLDNVKQHYAFIKRLSPKQLFAAKMAFESSEVIRKVDEKVPELEEQLKSSVEELAHICKALKIELPSKEELVEKAVSNITEHGE